MLDEWCECAQCGDEFPVKRRQLGYRLCLFCGEEAARDERSSWCIVQEYGKGPYQLVTTTAAPITLKQTNQKELRA
jgi:hypothetical protein